MGISLPEGAPTELEAGCHSDGSPTSLGIISRALKGMTIILNRDTCIQTLS